MTTRIPEYYYNSSLAHCVYNGATATQFGSRHLHGEIVALGVLCLLTYDGQLEQRNRIMAFNHQIGLPVCFDELDIDESEFEAIAKRTQAGAEWQFRAPDITEESFIQCMRQQNQAGRAFLAAMQRGG